MTEVWKGSIHFDGERGSIEDVHLSSTNTPARPILGPKSSLRFLSVVHTSRIPLYLAAGPSYEVATESEATRAWLTEHLLDTTEDEGPDALLFEPWWAHPGKQSTYGILVKVEDENKAVKATEILFYAAVQTKNRGLAIGPASSSPTLPGRDPPSNNDEGPRHLKVFAIPLCSDIIYQTKEVSGLCSPPPENGSSFTSAYFLPDLQPEAISSIKRQKLSSLFEDASLQRRKAKGRGGESVAKTMATLDQPASLFNPLKNTSSDDNLGGDSNIGTQKGRASLARASSSNSVASLDNTRSAFRSGSSAPTKPSSLHRVESALSPREGSILPHSDNFFAQQNKAALTKVVMAGMRLHGMQQKKVSGKGSNNLEHRRSASLTSSEILRNGENEYKLVYHQTFKAASFVLRAHFSVRVVTQEAMREIVDKLLTLFCMDPMSSNEDHDQFPSSLQTTGFEPSSAFDLPSSSAPATMLTTGSNKSNPKKKIVGLEQV